MEGLSLLIPAYNEALRIGETIRESVRALELIGCEYEIIIVDDGSTDDTPSEIENIARHYDSVKYVFLPENMGKGNAVKRGFQLSTKELVCFLDADLDINPYQVRRLISEMNRTWADVVVGSKRHPRSELEYPRARKLYSSIYYLLIFILFRLPVKDTQTGIKLFRREVLLRALPRVVSMKYVTDLEILLVANYMGFRIVEAPVRISFQREYGRITWSDIGNILVDTMSIFYRFYLLGYYGSPLRPPSIEEPRVSIVIPTRHIDSMVEECIRKCRELNYSNFDIKVVTDKHEDRELPGPGIRMIPSGSIGPAEKRNMGVADSDAEIVAFIDGDAFPDYDWLKNGVAYFEEREVAAVGGPAVTPANNNRRQQASGMVYSATLVSGSTRYRYRPHGFKKVDDYPTSNLLVRRSDFEASGGFDEEFYPGEDTVLCLKLTHELGKQILYVPNVLVYHHRRAVLVPHLRQVFSYAVHRGFFVKKFPKTSLRLQYFIPSIFTIFVVAGLIGSIFANWILYPYLSIMVLYMLLALVSSVKCLDVLINMLVFPGIISTHLTYGTGFMIGLFSRKMKEQ